jgi:L-threonylcarbamoyladenylate synthase
MLPETSPAVDDRVNGVERVTVSPTDPEPRVLAGAAGVLSHGGLAIFPTDTLYGLAADPRNSAGVARVFRLKGRAAAQALPLVAASLEQVERSLGGVSGHTRRLADCFWPGPLTLIVEAGPEVAMAVLGGEGTVAVRVPNHAVARGLAASLGFPVVSTSANRAGQAAPATAEDAIAALGDEVDIVLDAGPVAGGEPSTIVDARGDEIRLIRAGAIPFSRVLEAL